MGKNFTKHIIVNLAIPHLSYSLRYSFLLYTLGVSLWLGLITLSHAGITIVPAQPVWSVQWLCMAPNYPSGNFNWTQEYNPNIGIHCDHRDSEIIAGGWALAIKRGTCEQAGGPYDLEITVGGQNGGEVRVHRDFKLRCALMYRCTVGSGVPSTTSLGFEVPPPAGYIPPYCIRGTFDSSPPPPSLPPPAGGPGGPVADYYYLLLTDGTTFPLDEGGTGIRPLDMIDLEPALRTQPIFAYVYSANTGAPVPGVSLEITATVSEKSAGHVHLDGRPKGELIAIEPHTGKSGDNGVLKGTTAADGALLFQFKAPVVAGDHSITAHCTDRDCGEATGVIQVGVKGLQALSIYNYSVYRLVGQTNAHPDNHYLTLTAASRATVLAAFYQIKYPNRAVLHLNDASLERGGVFDIFPEASPNWKSPHFEHCRGTVIDIRANGVEGALDIASDEDPAIQVIQDLGAIVGADPRWEIPKVTNPATGQKEERWDLRHFHTKLMGQEGIQCP